MAEVEESNEYLPPSASTEVESHEVLEIPEHHAHPEEEGYVDTTAPHGVPIAGDVCEFYVMGEQLGSGAYSSVFRGTHKETNEEFAIKRVSKSKMKSQSDIRSLFEEVGILQEIHHPHVMRLFEFYEDARSYNLVTEMVVGGELFDRIVERKHYNELIASRLVKTLLQTLDFLHSHGIVHRDLKPENLLLSSHEDDADIKLADFGFAKHTSQRLDTICGTPDYIAPEIVSLMDLRKVPKQNRPQYGTKCDIWSAGVITYILLGGYPPFFDQNQKKLFAKIRAGRFEFHARYWSHVSADSKDLIRQMLVVDPNQRASAAELLQHPWLSESDDTLTDRPLEPTLAELKKFNARRKFRGAVLAVNATRRISSLMQGHKSETEGSTKEAEQEADEA